MGNSLNAILSLTLFFPLAILFPLEKRVLYVYLLALGYRESYNVIQAFSFLPVRKRKTWWSVRGGEGLAGGTPFILPKSKCHFCWRIGLNGKACISEKVMRWQHDSFRTCTVQSNIGSIAGGECHFKIWFQCERSPRSIHLVCASRSSSFAFDWSCFRAANPSHCNAPSTKQPWVNLDCRLVGAKAANLRQPSHIFWLEYWVKLDSSWLKLTPGVLLKVTT